MYAKQMGYYANAINLSKEIIHLLPKYKLKYKEDLDLPKRITLMTSALVKLNNGYLEKGKSVLANKSHMLPYLVDKKLSRKKNQPEFVRNGEH